MHVASISICQSDLRQQIINRNVEDEMYAHVKDKLQQQSREKKHEGYKFEEDEIITYKNRIYIPNEVNFRRILMNKIYKMPSSSHP